MAEMLLKQSEGEFSISYGKMVSQSKYTAPSGILNKAMTRQGMNGLLCSAQLSVKYFGILRGNAMHWP